MEPAPALDESLLPTLSGGPIRNSHGAAGGPESVSVIADIAVMTEALREALTEIPQVLPVRAATFYMVQENGDLWSVGPVIGIAGGDTIPGIAALATETIARGRPLLVPADAAPAGAGEVYLVPLLIRTEPGLRAIGAAAFVAAAGRSFSQEDLLMAALMASRVTEAARHQRLDQELGYHREVQRRLLAEVISAQENERKRIAADIHNDILQILGYNLLKVEICQRYLELGDAERLQGEFSAMRSTLEESVQLLREIIFQLRPSTLDQRGLLATIDALVARFETETGITVRFSSRLGRRLEPHLETLVYRLVQEAFANIRKHSAATHARIAFRGKDREVEVLIEDNGRGFKVDEALERSLGQGHIGLHSMRERAELAGGSLTIQSREGRGTRLRFLLPRSP